MPLAHSLEISRSRERQTSSPLPCVAAVLVSARLLLCIPVSVSAIFFLGNPGAQYAHTRHNVAWLLLDALLADAGLPAPTPAKGMQADVAEARTADGRVLLVRPTTYMNLSGQAVQAVLAWHKIPVERALIVYDDIDLPLGAVRYRRSGSAGTHNGMRDIVAKAGGSAMPRLRIGIEARTPEHRGALHNYVLGAFTPDEQQLLTKHIFPAIIPGMIGEATRPDEAPWHRRVAQPIPLPDTNPR